MPTRAALRVIQNNNEYTQAGNVSLPSNEDAVIGAYQVLADAIGASLEVTLDGQVVLYTGHFKADLQGVEDPKTPEHFDLHAPKVQRDLSTPEARAAAQREDVQSPEGSTTGYIKGRVPTPEDLTLEELEELKNKRLLADRGPVFTVGETTDAAVDAYYANRNNQ